MMITYTNNQIRDLILSKKEHEFLDYLHIHIIYIGLMRYAEGTLQLPHCAVDPIGVLNAVYPYSCSNLQ